MSTETTTDTAVNIKTIKMDMEGLISMKDPIEFNKVSLFTGANGTGKSVILKAAFAMGYIGSSYCAARDSLGKFLDSTELKELAEFAFSNTFSDFEHSGICEIILTNGATLSLTFTLGKCTSAIIVIANEDVFPPVNFLPTSLRLFSQIELYLKLRKTITINRTLVSAAEISSILENYKLYELVLVERLIGKSPIDVSSLDLKEHYDVDPIAYIEVDLDKCKIIARYSDNSEKNLATFSAGEQSIINMFMAQLL